MNCMFFKCSLLEKIIIPNFNLPKIRDMRSIFYGCSSLKELNFSNFNINNDLVDMNYMFFDCSEELKKSIRERYRNIRDEAFN